MNDVIGLWIIALAFAILFSYVNSSYFKELAKMVAITMGFITLIFIGSIFLAGGM